jgi:hypothetical protein
MERSAGGWKKNFFFFWADGNEFLHFLRLRWMINNNQQSSVHQHPPNKIHPHSNNFDSLLKQSVKYFHSIC